MKAFDWQRMVLDKVPVEFLAEVALRSLYTFVLVFIFLKITGRRGVRQMSLFEVLIILTLGSAAGDVAFYDDVPLLPVLVVFITLALLYRGIMWLMGHSEKLEDLLEGKPIVVVEEGQLAWEKLHAENMTEFEFFMELRVNSVEQLGQVRLAILETNGQISFLPKSRVRPLTPEDMQLHPAAASAWYDLIIDGQLMQDNLRAAGRDERWLDARLHAEGIGQRSEVFYAACDKGDGFFACRAK